MIFEAFLQALAIRDRQRQTPRDETPQEPVCYWALLASVHGTWRVVSKHKDRAAAVRAAHRWHRKHVRTAMYEVRTP